ncbi:MAG TPA: metal ABC transporter permease [Chlamydiales bacterium]|nr:metal ABC transporter permease [Chlamydiales bacterium]
MMDFLTPLFNPFLQHALIAAILASFASGVIGSYVVVKRIVFISGSIAHSVLGGMGLFLWLKRVYGIDWLEPIYGAFLAAILSALLIGWISLRFKQRKDAVIASIWSTGMAVGVIFVSLTPGYNVELMNFLFGNILWITKTDLWLLLILDLFVLWVVGKNYFKFLAVCFDEEQAVLQGVHVERTYLLLLSLVALSVVLLIEIIGVILVIALLTLPPTIAGLFTRKLSKMMVFAVLLTIIFNVVGVFLSYQINWPMGATIALLVAAAYLFSLLVKNSVAIGQKI